jgi:hypothetical protein
MRRIGQGIAARIYGATMRLLPREFGTVHAAEMKLLFGDRYGRAREDGRLAAVGLLNPGGGGRDTDCVESEACHGVAEP